MINAVNYGKFVEHEALTFIQMFYEESGRSIEERDERIAAIVDCGRKTGTYTHTIEELTYGARVAWRNNSRCIGRLFWESLEVIDERGADTEEAIAEALLRHVAYATNDGRIRPVITVFAPESDGRRIRIWNHQLIRYAGYVTADGIIGDPASVDFTEQCMCLGWTGRGTRFDILPLVVQIADRQPKWFPIPDSHIKEIDFVHPDIENFNELGLRWYAVPIISDMVLDIGGIRYTAAPFNGWYMGTEIGARNLADVDRYNELPAIANLMGLDRSTNTSLWKDRALLELNTAVIHSFKLNGVSIVDHHTAAEQFMRFMKREQDNGRNVNARWSWLIPPMSPAATPIWNHSFEERDVKPDFILQPRAY
ncbi:nitric oxide synthase oxygenase [Cohnella silvisoli]|uniref:Nitric oxide synthase oxygenase n=1 Tax=Cohnella silvisoli TaxID=2873699 RepID=A0ABV1KXU3_9BACL|nr:nitric oxide synthase oxygenase [Cohnella silvisoli]MCD9021901.1 nitric oxide synthase oxygenase [Cohnella silvisoli]